MYIDYARQFTGATGGGVTAAARKAARQQGPDAGHGALAAGSRPKARKRHGQKGAGTQTGAAAGSGGGVGHWEGTPGNMVSGPLLLGSELVHSP